MSTNRNPQPAETDAQRWQRKIRDAETRQTRRDAQTDETEAQRRMAESGLRRAIEERKNAQ